jgi:uncharacterized protein
MKTETQLGAGERLFLSAEWRDLVILNYAVDPGLLDRYVPKTTELDSFAGKTYVSLVGFRFRRTRLFGGVPLPFHTNFDEINLRFYVRRPLPNGDRRGVVFISEVVPRRAVAIVARLAYGENYRRYPMRHKVTLRPARAFVPLVNPVPGPSVDLHSSSAEAPRPAEYHCEYEFRLAGKWCRLYAGSPGPGMVPEQGSLEQFITEHYWGYAARRDKGVVEYHVSHLTWRVWGSREAGFHGSAASLYGPALAEVIGQPPDSAFIADGSPVLVSTGRAIV